MKFKELQQNMEAYEWLKGIAEDYQNGIDRIDAEGDYFKVQDVLYSARGDTQSLKINCHRPISHVYIREGLQEALNGIKAELNDLENELKEWL